MNLNDFFHHYLTVALVSGFILICYVLRWMLYPYNLGILEEPRWFFRLRRRFRRWRWRQADKPLFANLLHIGTILFSISCLVWVLWMMAISGPVILFW